MYRIIAPQGYRIKLTFLDLDITPSTSCNSDRLEIRGADRSSIIGIFCGSLIPRPVLSHEDENELYLVFQTGDYKSGRGFKIQYESGRNIDLCANNQAHCKNRNCYAVSKACDGVDDCGDGTDEEDCDYPVTTSECGKPPIKPRTIYGAPDRMVGGHEAVPNSWPWHASIQLANVEPNGHFCSGSLINAQWVLTAARCFSNAPFPRSIRITLGSHKMFNRSEYEQTRSAAKIISYPDLEDEALKEASLEDDLALVKLNAPVLFNKGVRPACLPYEHWKEKVGWQCYTTGWGEAKGAGFSDSLKQSVYQIKSVDHCSHNDDKQICVVSEESGPCKDDAGSPLVCPLGYNWYLLGVTSGVAKENPYSGLCSKVNSKVLFTRLAHKAAWISKTIERYS